MLEIFSNPVFQGAGMVGLGGALWTQIRSVPNKIYDKIRVYLTHSIFIGARDSMELIEAILDRVQREQNKKIKELLVSLDWDDDDEEVAILKTRPNDNSYRVKYKNRQIFITLEKKKDANGKSGDENGLTSTGGMGGNSSAELIGLRISSFFLGKSDLIDFVNFSLEEVNSKKKTDIKIYGHRNGWWDASSKTQRRNLSTLVFNDPDLQSKLVEDINAFLGRKDWYNQMGIPHRRGYLLYGEPGNGKTSLIRAIASSLNFSIAVIHLTNMSDETLNALLTQVPRRTMVLFEDIDCLTDSSKKKEPNKEENSNTNDSRSMSSSFTPTFSGLLNSLDGISTTEDRIVFLTTNKKHLLDDALIRPGRCDKHIYIGNPTNETIKKLYLKFFPTDIEAMADEFSMKIFAKSPSMAQVQEDLLAIKEQRDLHIL